MNEPEYCPALVQLTESRRSEIALLVSREMGKPIRDSEAEVGSVAALFLGYAEKAKHLCGETLPRTGERGVENDFAFTIREPLGVMACIVPFNYPVDLFSHKVAPALIMGNAVIVKPACNPSAAALLVELLLQSGVPSGAIQMLTGRGESLGTLLAESERIHAISFTGSTRAGIDIASRAAANMTRVFLECGGMTLSSFSRTPISTSQLRSSCFRAHSTQVKRAVRQNEYSHTTRYARV